MKTKYIKYYKMWLPDVVEPEGGFWTYMGMDEEGFLHQLNGFDEQDEQLDTYEQYLQWGYKIEEL